jgi:hypothetical protein
VGGPSTINLLVDYGAQGQRGSQIYTGPGNPTDAGMDIPSLQINDLFINLDPSSIDYLFLWQYNSQEGVIAWRKALRLIPNTVIINPLIKFVNGEAHTVIFNGLAYEELKGIYFPLSGFGEGAALGNLQAKDFNVQHTVTSEKPAASSIILKQVATQQNVEIFANGQYSQVNNYDFGVLVLSASLTAREYDSVSDSWTALNGYRIVNFLATVGGRSRAVLDFETSSVNESLNTITIPSHGLVSGQRVVYLKNFSSSLGGLENEAEYAAVRLDDSTISLTTLAAVPIPIDISLGTASGQHSLGVLGAGL